MIEIGSQVRIGARGVSVFRVLDIEDGRALIESVEDVPGRYPFSMRLQDLVGVTE